VARDHTRVTAPIASNDPDALFSSARFKMITTVSADIDLVALGGGPCRAIRVLADGDLVVVPADLLPGQTSETLSPLLGGDHLPIQATKIIDSGTSAIPMIVFW
jgi:hypothetical protein